MACGYRGVPRNGFCSRRFSREPFGRRGKARGRGRSYRGRYTHAAAGAGERIARQRDGSRRQGAARQRRSEEHTSELQSLMRISYAVFCLKKKKHTLPAKQITKLLMNMKDYSTIKSHHTNEHTVI